VASDVTVFAPIEI